MILNLDKLAAKRAQRMVETTPDAQKETLERLSAKALGILKEQGVYALMLFLFSRTGDESKVAPLIRAQLFKGLSQLPELQGDSKLIAFNSKTDAAQVLSFYTERILDETNVDLLLLVRDLYEQTLIYARYGAKAAGG